MIGESVAGLATLIVPRHPERGNAIADMLSREGIRFAQHTKAQMPQPQDEIYLMDTLGEMGLAYRLAEIAFIGGSLVPHGGQKIRLRRRSSIAPFCTGRISVILKPCLMIWRQKARRRKSMMPPPSPHRSKPCSIIARPLRK